MNSYVLVYERSTGALRHEKSGPGRRAEAFARRSVLDRQVGPGVEVIVLHGNSLEDLRTTHRRYSEDVHQLVARLAVSTGRRTWRSWEEVADVFGTPEDAERAADRDLVDQSVEDPWERHGEPRSPVAVVPARDVSPSEPEPAPPGARPRGTSS